MRVYLEAEYADGVRRCGTDHGAVRSDLTTERGARRWALAWLARRPTFDLCRATGVRVSLVSDGRPYGEAFREFSIRPTPEVA